MAQPRDQAQNNLRGSGGSDLDFGMDISMDDLLLLSQLPPEEQEAFRLNLLANGDSKSGKDKKGLDKKGKKEQDPLTDGFGLGGLGPTTVPTEVLQKNINKIKEDYYFPGLTSKDIEIRFKSLFDPEKKTYESPYLFNKPTEQDENSKEFYRLPYFWIDIDDTHRRLANLTVPESQNCFLLIAPYYEWTMPSENFVPDETDCSIFQRHLKWDTLVYLVTAVPAGYQACKLGSDNEFLPEDFYEDLDSIINLEVDEHTFEREEWGDSDEGIVVDVDGVTHSVLFNEPTSVIDYMRSLDRIAKKFAAEQKEAEEREQKEKEEKERKAKEKKEREAKEKENKEKEKKEKENKHNKDDKESKEPEDALMLMQPTYTLPPTPAEKLSFQHKVLECLLSGNLQEFRKIVKKGDDLNFVCDYPGNGSTPAVVNASPLSIAVMRLQANQPQLLTILLQYGLTLILPHFQSQASLEKNTHSYVELMVKILFQTQQWGLFNNIRNIIFNEFKKYYEINLNPNQLQIPEFAAIGDVNYLMKIFSDLEREWNYKEEQHVLLARTTDNQVVYIPVMLAALSGSFETFRFLLHKTLKYSKEPIFSAILPVTAAGGHLNCFKYAYENLKQFFFHTRPDHFREMSLRAFFKAIRHGRFAVTQFLLNDNPFLLAYENENQETAFQVLANAEIPEDHKALFKDLFTKSKNQKGAPLVWIAFTNHSDVMKEMCKLNPRLIYDIWEGDTLLHAAINDEDVETVVFLLDQDKEEGENRLICRVNNENDTPLSRAARSGNVAIYELVLGAFKTPTDKIDALQIADVNGRLPFHRAVFYGHLDIVNSMISLSDDFKAFLLNYNTKGINGFDMACLGGFKPMIELFINWAPREARNTNIQKAIMTILKIPNRRGQHLESLQFLFEQLEGPDIASLSSDLRSDLRSEPESSIARAYQTAHPLKNYFNLFINQIHSLTQKAKDNKLESEMQAYKTKIKTMQAQLQKYTQELNRVTTEIEHIPKLSGELNQELKQLELELDAWKSQFGKEAKGTLERAMAQVDTLVNMDLSDENETGHGNGNGNSSGSGNSSGNGSQKPKSSKTINAHNERIRKLKSAIAKNDVKAFSDLLQSNPELLSVRGSQGPLLLSALNRGVFDIVKSMLEMDPFLAFASEFRKKLYSMEFLDQEINTEVEIEIFELLYEQLITVLEKSNNRQFMELAELAKQVNQLRATVFSLSEILASKQELLESMKAENQLILNRISSVRREITKFEIHFGTDEFKRRQKLIKLQFSLEDKDAKDLREAENGAATPLPFKMKSHHFRHIQFSDNKPKKKGNGDLKILPEKRKAEDELPKPKDKKDDAGAAAAAAGAEVEKEADSAADKDATTGQPFKKQRKS